MTKSPCGLSKWKGTSHRIARKVMDKKTNLHERTKSFQHSGSQAQATSWKEPRQSETE
ncbi:MAG: hypothetical protein RI897_1280 [Verrucomicrobiota bacterium]